MSTPSHSAKVRASAWVKRPTPHPKSSARPGVTTTPRSCSHASRSVDLVDTRCKELVDVPGVRPAIGTGDDRKVRIAAPPLVPVALELVEIHVAMLPPAVGLRREMWRSFGAAGPGALEPGAARTPASRRRRGCCRTPTTRLRRRRAARAIVRPSRSRDSWHPATGRCSCRSRLGRGWCTARARLRGCARPRRGTRRATRRRSRPRGLRAGATRSGRGRAWSPCRARVGPRTAGPRPRPPRTGHRPARASARAP